VGQAHSPHGVLNPPREKEGINIETPRPHLPSSRSFDTLALDRGATSDPIVGRGPPLLRCLFAMNREFQCVKNTRAKDGVSPAPIGKVASSHVIDENRDVDMKPDTTFISKAHRSCPIPDRRSSLATEKDKRGLGRVRSWSALIGGEGPLDSTRVGVHDGEAPQGAPTSGYALRDTIAGGPTCVSARSHVVSLEARLI